MLYAECRRMDGKQNRMKEWKEETERKIINKKKLYGTFETETKMKQVAIHIII